MLTAEPVLRDTGFSKKNVVKGRVLLKTDVFHRLLELHYSEMVS